MIIVSVISLFPRRRESGRSLLDSRLRGNDVYVVAKFMIKAQPVIYGNQQSLATSNLWQPAIYGNQQSMATNNLWQPAIFGNQQSMATNNLWQPTTCSSQQHAATNNM